MRNGAAPVVDQNRVQASRSDTSCGMTWAGRYSRVPPVEEKISRCGVSRD
jgi:hypothetical protein